MTKRLFTLAMLSAGGFLLEITLTRLFSTLFFPPYVFAVISLAILGIGLGAGAAAWRANLRREDFVPLYGIAAGISCLILVIFTVLTTAIDARPVLFILVTIPYACVGLAVATIFSADGGSSTRLYMADLLGAGMGAIAAVFILNAISPVNAILLVAVIFGVSVMHRRAMIFAAIALIVFAGNLSQDVLQIDLADLHSDKSASLRLQEDGASLLETHSDAFARTDLIQPADGSAYQIYVDGGAGSVMPPAADNEFLFGDIGFFPFATNQPQRVLVIGPGGGLDVWFGLQSGAASIVGYEVNAASVQLVEDYADYNGDLYHQPGVRIVVDEGRSALRREGSFYDLIFLSQVITSTAERSGYALSENTIYTVEAFQDYLDHLNPGGFLALKMYDEPTLTRALSIAIAAFNERGLSDADAMQHMAVFLDPGANVPLLMIAREPYSEDDALAYGQVATDVGFAPLFLPGVFSQPPLSEVESGEMSFAQIIDSSDIDFSAPTDDRPFFFQFEKGIPDELARLLIALVVIASLMALMLVMVQRQSPTQRYAPLYFAALGAGFIGIEIAVIQQTRLFLGHPTLAITTVLATVLIGGGVGSLLGGQWIEAKKGTIPALPALGVILVLAAWLYVWTGLKDQFLAEDVLIRMVIVVVSLAPLAMLMGMPFPLGLRALSDDRSVAIAWTVNGVMTVLGSVGAITLAIVAGFFSVMIVSGVLYGFAAGVAFLLLKEDG
jgi:hypothetical protein